MKKRRDPFRMAGHDWPSTIEGLAWRPEGRPGRRTVTRYRYPLASPRPCRACPRHGANDRPRRHAPGNRCRAIVIANRRTDDRPRRVAGPPCLALRPRVQMGAILGLAEVVRTHRPRLAGTRPPSRAGGTRCAAPPKSRWPSALSSKAQDAQALRSTMPRYDRAASHAGPRDAEESATECSTTRPPCGATSPCPGWDQEADHRRHSGWAAGITRSSGRCGCTGDIETQHHLSPRHRAEPAADCVHQAHHGSATGV